MKDMPTIAEKKKPEECEIKKCGSEKPEKKSTAGDFGIDDIILGIVILTILMDDGDDTLLLLALLAVFLSGHI